jgi:hypothetical protein
MILNYPPEIVLRAADALRYQHNAWSSPGVNNGVAGTCLADRYFAQMAYTKF